MGRMHADEAEIDEPLVRQLLAAQFLQWADLPLSRVESAGTDNAIYRLGDDLAVRLPQVVAATAQVDKEQQWLQRLAPLLPLAIPTPLALGASAEGYPWRWSVYRWLDGDNAMNVRVADPSGAATELATFVAALHRIDPTGGPAPGAHNFGRGVPLALRDGFTRNAITSCGSLIDTDAVIAAWDKDLHAPAWDQPPVWIHGDLLPGNLLVKHGRLSAVIDFGGLGVGDPAVDMLGAWAALSGETRDLFRSELAVDDATWARGRGWALSIALVQLPYYQHTNPVLAGISRYLISEVLADHAAAGL
jgi:aminoglycoside phosphotransferase (APT) family kinase protein